MNSLGIKANGRIYDVLIEYDSLKRSFEILEGANKGTAILKNDIRDVMATRYSFHLTVRANPENYQDYNDFYELITSPVESVYIEILSDTSHTKFYAGVQSGSDNFKGIENGEEIWDELELELIPIYPQRMANNPLPNEPYNISELITGNLVSFTDSSGKILTIRQYAFANCSKLVDVNLPNLTSVNSWAFERCYSLKNVSIPNVSIIGSFAFSDNTQLENVYAPNVQNINSSAFAYCTNLSEINFPKCSYIGTYAFNNCSHLKGINFSSYISISTYAFYNCKAMSYARIAINASLFAANVFNGCQMLENLYFNCTKLVSLTSTVCFTNTPFTKSSYLGYYGKIYVPFSLLSSYKNDITWNSVSHCLSGYNF